MGDEVPVKPAAKEVKIDETLAEDRDAEKATVVSEVRRLTEACLNPATTMTRKVVVDWLEAFGKLVCERLDTFAKDADERLHEYESGAIEEADARASAAKDAEDAMRDRYLTALRILEQDAGVSERDLDLVMPQADPVGVLEAWRWISKRCGSC